jgi:hypothetical protein
MNKIKNSYTSRNKKVHRRKEKKLQEIERKNSEKT